MKLKYRFAEQVVGVFILVAITSLAALLVLMGFNKRWFAQDYYFYSTFSSADGLSTGMPIKLKGFKIGTADEILLNDKNEVVLRFHIFEEYIEKVKVNSVLELASNPLGLGGGLRFHPGKSLALAIGDEEEGYIPSLDTAEGRSLVEQNLVDTGDSGDSISQLIQDINTTANTLESVLAKLDSALEGTDPGPVGTILANVEDMTGEITDVVSDVNMVVSDADVMLGEITGRIYPLLENIETISGDISRLTEGLSQPRGLVTKLLDPKGSVAKILDDDEELFLQIEGILAGIDETVQQLNDFSVYLNSATPQISGVLEEGRDVLDQGQDVIQGLRNNPLIRGGIPEGKDQPTTFQSYRDEDF